MTKAEQLVAAVKLAEPDKTEEEILGDLLNRGLIHRGYVIDESMELESNIGKPSPARLVKKWVVVKDGRTEFRAETERKRRVVQTRVAVTVGGSAQIDGERPKAAPGRKLRQQLVHVGFVVVEGKETVERQFLSPLQDSPRAEAGAPFQIRPRSRLDVSQKDASQFGKIVGPITIDRLRFAKKNNFRHA